MNQLLDLHCHILPGIDDGAKTPEDSRRLLQKEAADGVVGIVFTPHFNYERTTVDEFAQRSRLALAKVSAIVKEQRLPLAGKLGAEVYFTPALPSLELQKLAFYQSNYILIELPTGFHPSGIEDVLFGVQQQGYTPIIAHVERYPYVTEDPTLLYRWVCAGALAQINGAGFIRGGHTAQLLQRYLDWGLVHLLCSDAHNMEHRPPNLREAYSALNQNAEEMFRRNAVAVYLGKEPDVPFPREPKYRFGGWR